MKFQVVIDGNNNFFHPQHLLYKDTNVNIIFYYFIVSFYRSIYIKVYVQPKIPMLNELASGLELFGVLQAIKRHPDEMRKLFTITSSEDMSSDELLNILCVAFSLHQSLKDEEISTYKAFCDFLQKLEYKGK